LEYILEFAKNDGVEVVGEGLVLFQERIEVARGD
jgi:hypothetical protein